MKKFLSVLVALVLPACTTAQLQQAQTIAKPIELAALSAAGAYFGVPPTDTQAAITAFGALWGAVQQVRAGQPAAQGTTIPAVGTAITNAIPSGTSTAQTIAALTVAANSINLK